MLADVMYRSDFMEEESSFHPELLALNERGTVTEVMLQNPVFKTTDDQSEQNHPSSNQVFYISDYPLLCYLAQEGDCQKLVMIHLADQLHPQKAFELQENEKFVQFVDQTQSKHSASIMVLLYNSELKRPVIKTFCYKDPFESKDFESEEYWQVDEGIEISEDASQKIKEVLFQKNWKEQLAAGFRKKLKLEA